MHRTQTYGGRTRDRSRMAKDAETVLGNSLATMIAAGAGALAVIGLLVGFNIMETDNPFNNGLLWLAAAIATALCANVFRREHHIIDEDEVKAGMSPDRGYTDRGDGGRYDTDVTPRDRERGTLR
jgi:hypothetical protein